MRNNPETNEEAKNKKTHTAFGPPEILPNGLPVCYGNFISGRRCNCQYAQSCTFYTYDNKAERVRGTHFAEYETVPLNENILSKTLLDERDFSVEDEEDGIVVKLENGKKINIGNLAPGALKLLLWFTLENPSAMRAILLKMDSNVKCLQDIADIVGVSKQAIQKRIAAELGIGKHKKKETPVEKMTNRNYLIYKLIEQKPKATAEDILQILENSDDKIDEIIEKIQRDKEEKRKLISEKVKKSISARRKKQETKKGQMFFSDL